MARVRLHQVSRQLNSTVVVSDISFEVPDGAFWVLVGPSGCGKSTILRTIAGLDQPTSGDVFIGDRRVNDLPARQRDVAMVFQNYALYPHMTVAENLAFGLKMRGMSDRALLHERILTVAKSLSIDHLLERKPAQLSGGQQQRVALGRAIARKPQVFLLDEPLSNLDAQLRDETRAELKRLHQQLGITTLYVTHDQVEAMTLADQIVVLNQGRVQQIGDPQTLYDTPANQMVATFLGNPPMNLLPAQWAGDGVKVGEFVLPLVRGALTAGAAVNVGIRPEHLTVVTAPSEGHLCVTVTLVEPLGREILLRANITPIRGSESGKELPVPVSLQVAPEVRPKVGDRLWLQADLSQIHLFQPVTGQRVV